MANKIDEGLYSRQLYVLGHEAMQQMSQSNVLLVGLGGLGVEIAKNVILAGVKSVTLLDRSKIQVADLSSQFFLQEADIGQPKDKVTQPRLVDLNSYVPVHVFEGELNDSTISKYQVVVVTDRDHDEKVQINELARKHRVKFIAAETRGLFGFAFNDFGLDFKVSDTTGENALSGMISAVSKDADGVVACLEDQRHGLEDGDYVTFTEVQGMAELNDITPRKITVTGPFTFKIGDTSSFGDYKTGGYFKQVKMPKVLQFKTLAQSFPDPEVIIADFAKFDRPSQLHVAFQAIGVFRKKHSRLPAPRNESDANDFLAIVKDLGAKLASPPDFDEKLIKEFSYQARGDLPPMNAVLGGLVAQEVLKACSGKFMPNFQYFYFDSLESLPKSVALTEEGCKPTGSRYDNQIAVFGKEFQNRIANARQFLVGAGAIGCEMLKNWALMGLGTGPEGKIIITDMDTIEKSNLNRQFLFRPWDVSKLKSECAASAVEKMNPATKGKIKTFAERVGPDSEKIFDKDFWAGLTGVTNALDNIDARRYMDRRCIFYGKPLLESGTLGTKGNTQVVIPNLTESYSSSNDPPEKSIPSCTLKNFPNAIEHTIQWGRDLFEGYFTKSIESANMYLNDVNFVESTMKQGGNNKETFESILSNLVTDKAENFEDCVTWARLQFEEQYHNKILQLLYNFPKDAVTSSGVPFWSGPKRAPDALDFNADNELHMAFILAAANLRAFNYGVPQEKDINKIKAILKTVMVPEFSPKAGVKIAVLESEANQQAQADESDLDKIIKALPDQSKFGSKRLVPADFEKDDDTNFHIDFITAASNLRATNYSITVADRHQTKFIAGKIIPAIATTTALVTGLVCLELYKVIDQRRVLEDYKNAFVNLALPLYAFSEPIAAQKFKYHDVEWTLWDRFDLRGDMSLSHFIKHFKDNYELEITMLSCGQTMVYSFFMPKKKLEERMNLNFVQILEQISKKPVPEHTKVLMLEMCVNDREGEDVEVPPVVIHL